MYTKDAVKRVLSFNVLLVVGSSALLPGERWLFCGIKILLHCVFALSTIQSMLVGFNSHFSFFVVADGAMF